MRNAVLCLLAAAVVTLGGCDRGPSAKKRELSPKQREAAYIELHKDRIKSRLKDPGSAQFRDVYVSQSSGSPIVCGMVNAKNSMGGYTGYTRFFSGGSLQILESDMAAGEMDKSWSKLCRR